MPNSNKRKRRKRGEKNGVLTSRQHEIIKKIAEKEKISRQTKYDVYSTVIKNAKKAIDDLSFLAKYLPEKLQKEIFKPELMISLTNKLLEYSKFKEVIKVPQAGRGKGLHLDDELRKDTKFIESPAKIFVPPFERLQVLPKETRNLIPKGQKKGDRNWGQTAGERIIYPSYQKTN